VVGEHFIAIFMRELFSPLNLFMSISADEKKRTGFGQLPFVLFVGADEMTVHVPLGLFLLPLDGEDRARRAAAG
jgi:hypothetical protein